jgi:hypothetical protein
MLVIRIPFAQGARPRLDSRYTSTSLKHKLVDAMRSGLVEGVAFTNLNERFGIATECDTKPQSSAHVRDMALP